MKDFNKKTDDLIKEYEKNEYIKNKKILVNMQVLIISNLIFYCGVVLLTSYAFGENLISGIIVTISTIILILVSFYSIKVEVDTGYYECKNCKNRFVPKYLTALIAPHINTTRYLKCPQCNNKSWCKKVFSKR